MHGATKGGKQTPEYKTWIKMIERCENRNCRSFVNYGGRGVRICAEWRRSFETFLRDMGLKPSSKHTIERIDNDGDYEPDNCQWAMMKEQARNKRNNVLLTHEGRMKCVAEWAEELGLSPTMIYKRLYRGWDCKRVLSKK